MKRVLYTLAILAALLALAVLMSRPSYLSYKDAIYNIEGTRVSLNEEGIRYFGNEAFGDLNGDGRDDVAFLFTYEPGGSGTFYYVAVALLTARGYVGTNAMLLGDRIAPQNTMIEEGDVIVNYAERKSGEPFTASPSVGVTSYFKIANGGLVYQGSR